MSTELPDSLAFAQNYLERRGALVERAGGHALALSPPELAREFDIPEECQLMRDQVSSDPSGPQSCSVALGSALLERLVETARACGGHVGATLDEAPPRPGQARSLAERFVFRNGVHDISEIAAGRSVYCFAWLRWAAECDDRYDGRVVVGTCEASGGQPSEEVARIVDPLRTPELVERELAALTAASAQRIAAWLEERSRLACREKLAEIQASTLRRKRRDHQRVTQYFEELAVEAKQGKRRARIDDAALAKRIEQYRQERDTKLRNLDERFAIRVSFTPIAILRVELPVIFARLRVRRRKQARELTLTLPCASPRLDHPACEACHGPAEAPALCDEQLHLLCQSCIPEARGRIACPACRGS